MGRMNLEFVDIAHAVAVCLVVTSAQVWLAGWLRRREEIFAFWGRKYTVSLVCGNLALLLISLYRQNVGREAAAWYFTIWAYLFDMGIYDLKCKELPDILHLLPVVFYGAAWLFGYQPVAVQESLLVVLLLAAGLGLVYIIRKDAIGLGDIKLILVCALYLGAGCTGMLVRGMVAAFVCSMVLLLGKKVTAKSGLPFVPFLLLGALFA